MAVVALQVSPDEAHARSRQRDMREAWAPATVRGVVSDLQWVTRGRWTQAELHTLVRYAQSAKLRKTIFGAVRFDIVVTDDGLNFRGRMQVEPRDKAEIDRIVEAEYRHADYGMGAIPPWVSVCDRPRTIEVTSRATLSGLTILRATDPDHLFRVWVREQLHAMVTHEVDEMLEIDGKRVFDPHGMEDIPLKV